MAETATFAGAISRFPFKGNPATLIAGRDGYLYGALREVLPRGGGAVYRVASDGEFKTLRTFGSLPVIPGKNSGGSSPDDKFIVGRDGCLYGLTDNGGLHGRGVLYCIRPDGHFSVVADLDPGMLPAGTLDTVYFADSARGFVEGPDGAFYTCMYPTGAIVRIGRDGVMTRIGTAGGFTRALTNPDDPAEVILMRQHWWESQFPVKRVRLTDASVVEEFQSPVYSNVSVDPIAWASGGLLVYLTWYDSASQLVGRLDLLKSDGSSTTLFNFDGVDGNDIPPLMETFVSLEADGTLLYSSGWSPKGLAGGGNTLIELQPGGSFRPVCGFGDFGFFNVAKAPDGSLFGGTFAPGYYLPKNENTEFFEGWMKPSNSENFISKPQRSTGGLLFQVSLDGSSHPNMPPLADIDVVMAKGPAPMAISPLRNDRDPEGGVLGLVSAGPASRGSVVVETRRDGSSGLLYTPAEGGRRSAVVPYQVEDEGGLQSTGTVLFRGNCEGSYQDDQLLVAKRPFALRVKPDGSFSAKVPGAPGKAVAVSGELDFNDQGFATVALSGGSWVTLKLTAVFEEGGAVAFDYQLDYSSGSVFAGRAH